MKLPASNQKQMAAMMAEAQAMNEKKAAAAPTQLKREPKQRVEEWVDELLVDPQYTSDDRRFVGDALLALKWYNPVQHGGHILNLLQKESVSVIARQNLLKRPEYQEAMLKLIQEEELPVAERASAVLYYLRTPELTREQRQRVWLELYSHYHDTGSIALMEEVMRDTKAIPMKAVKDSKNLLELAVADKNIRFVELYLSRLSEDKDAVSNLLTTEKLDGTTGFSVFLKEAKLAVAGKSTYSKEDWFYLLVALKRSGVKDILKTPNVAKTETLETIFSQDPEYLAILKDVESREFTSSVPRVAAREQPPRAAYTPHYDMSKVALQQMKGLYKVETFVKGTVINDVLDLTKTHATASIFAAVLNKKDTFGEPMYALNALVTYPNKEALGTGKWAKVTNVFKKLDLWRRITTLNQALPTACDRENFFHRHVKQVPGAQGLKDLATFAEVAKKQNAYIDLNTLSGEGFSPLHLAFKNVPDAELLNPSEALGEQLNLLQNYPYLNPYVTAGDGVTSVKTIIQDKLVAAKRQELVATGLSGDALTKELDAFKADELEMRVNRFLQAMGAEDTQQFQQTPEPIALPAFMLPPRDAKADAIELFKEVLPNYGSRYNQDETAVFTLKGSEQNLWHSALADTLAPPDATKGGRRAHKDLDAWSAKMAETLVNEKDQAVKLAIMASIGPVLLPSVAKKMSGIVNGITTDVVEAGVRDFTPTEISTVLAVKSTMDMLIQHVKDSIPEGTEATNPYTRLLFTPEHIETKEKFNAMDEYALPQSLYKPVTGILFAIENMSLDENHELNAVAGTASAFKEAAAVVLPGYGKQVRALFDAENPEIGRGVVPNSDYSGAFSDGGKNSTSTGSAPQP